MAPGFFCIKDGKARFTFMRDLERLLSADAADHAHWDAVEEAAELLHEERFQEAMVALRDVLRADAKNPYAFYFLGVALYETGQLEAARDAYRACVKVAPAHLGARVALVHVLRALGDLRGAIQEGSVALEQAPEDGDVLHALGLAHHARGDTVAARRYLEAFLATGPEIDAALEVEALLEAMGGDRPREEPS
jgi:tetratricopeptide (TPR) repeat protein